MMAGPWERYGGAGATPPAADGATVVGTPRPPNPIEQERLDLARRADARAQATHERSMAQPPASGMNANEARNRARAANLESLTNQINRVQELYEGGLRGQGLGSILEYLPDWASDTNAQFNSAAAGLSEQGLAAFRVPGVGAQSDAELRQFVMANRPQASDRDTAIEEKLRQLRARVDATRQSMGLPPAQWRQQGQQQAPAAAPSRPEGAVQFWDDPQRPVPPGGEQFQSDLQEAINRRFFTTPEQIIEYGAQRGFNIDRAQAEAAIRAGGAMVNQPRFQDPEISDMRGPEANLLIPEELDATLRGAADVATVGGVPYLRAARDSLLGGDSFGEELYRQYGVNEYDQENNPGYRLGGQLAGSFLVPSRAPQAFAAGGAAAGARRLAGEAAAYGGVYGFNSNPGSLGDRLGSAATNAVLGAGVGYGTGRTLGSLMSRPVTVPPERAEIIQTANDAADLGIDLNAWDLGGAGTRRTSAVIAQTPFGAAPIAAGNERVLQQSGRARDAIATRFGGIGEPVTAGEAAIHGANASRQRTGAQGRALFERARHLSEGVDVQPNTLTRTIAGHIAAEEQVLGGSPALAQLRNLQDDIARRGQVTVDGVRGLRTNLRSQLVDAGMTPDNADRIVNDLVQAAGADLASAFQRAGRPQALDAFQQADQFWAQRMDTIRNVLQPIVGRRSERTGEDVARALRNNAQGNGTRLAQFVQSLPAEDANIVRASLIGQLGRARSGNQSADGAAFSLDEFLTNWDQIRGSRERIFDREAFNALSQLARVAERAKAAGRYSNRSNTGSVVASGLLGAHALAEPISAFFHAAGTYGAGRLLSHPPFARWLARAPREPRALPAYVRRLSQLARTEPAIAADIAGLQRHLANAFAQSPSRIAAEEEVDRR